MKNSKGMDRSEVIKSILEGMKIVDTKRKQNSVRKTESLPKLSLKEEQIATPVKTKFHFRMEKWFEDINFSKKVANIEDEDCKIELITERRGINLSMPLMLPKSINKENYNTSNQENLNVKFKNNNKKSKKKYKKLKKRIKRRSKSQLESSLWERDDTPGVYRQFRRGIEGKSSLFKL